MKIGQSISAAVALTGVVAITVMLMKLADFTNTLYEQAPRLERRDQYCHQEKFQAESASDNLRSRDPATRAWGLGQFKGLGVGGWRMANMCAPQGISIGASCDDNDLPCQLAALDWAMVNIR